MRLSILYVFLLVALFSCKEDRDEEPPVVHISAPSAGLVITMPDTITVTAEASDNEKLTLLSYGLVDAGLNWAGERVYIPDPQNPESFSLTLEVVDLDIESGTHYVQVLASDGENDEREYVEVNVIAIPKIYEGTTYTYFEGNLEKLGYIRANGEQNELAQDSEGLQYAVSGRLGSAVISKLSTNEVYSTSLEFGEIEWSNPQVIPSTRSIIQNSFDQKERKFSILTDEPSILRYNKNGTQVGNFGIDFSYEVLFFIEGEDVFWLASNSTTGHRVSKIFKSTGAEIGHFSIGYTPSRMAMLTDDRIIIADDSGDLHILNVQTGDQFLVPVVGNDPVHSLVTEGNVAYLATANAVYRYPGSGGQAPAIYQSNGISGMTYDPVGQRLLICQGSSLDFYYPVPWQYLGSYAIQTGASDLQAVFNK